MWCGETEQPRELARRLRMSIRTASRRPRALRSVRAATGVNGSLDQLPPASLPPSPGVCYPALRRLPGRDSHPLELCSVTQPSFALPGSQPLRRNGAPCKPAYLRARDARVIRGGARPEQSNRSRRACAVTSGGAPNLAGIYAEASIRPIPATAGARCTSQSQTGGRGALLHPARGSGVDTTGRAVVAACPPSRRRAPGHFGSLQDP